MQLQGQNSHGLMLAACFTPPPTPPALSVWLATLAADLVHQVEGQVHVPPATLALTTAVLQLWGACCVGWMRAAEWCDAMGVWGLPAARHMQRLVHEVSSRPLVGSGAGWRERDVDNALVCLMVTWRELTPREEAPTPGVLCASLRYLRTLESLEALGGGDTEPQQQPQQQQGRQGRAGRRARQRSQAQEPQEGPADLQPALVELKMLLHQVGVTADV
jgi:hypothetical protein